MVHFELWKLGLLCNFLFNFNDPAFLHNARSSIVKGNVTSFVPCLSLFVAMDGGQKFLSAHHLLKAATEASENILSLLF